MWHVMVADEFVDMARGAPTKEALADALNECFPEAARLASASQHLRDLFYTACPHFEWEVSSPWSGNAFCEMAWLAAVYEVSVCSSIRFSGRDI